jgi:uncharacterized protein YbcI
MTSATPPRPVAGGDPLANTSRRIVQLHKEYYGKGPTRARTYAQDDLIVVLLRGVFTRIEQTLVTEGQGQLVLAQRHAFQEIMRERFVTVVEEEFRRKVVAMMSSNHEDEELSVEVFVMQPQAADGQAPDGESAA